MVNSRTGGDAIGMGLVGFVAALIAYAYYTGLYCSDDTRYMIGAIRMSMGEDIATGSLAERRAVLLLPAALIYGLTQNIGLSVAAYALFYIGVGLAAYALARQFFGRGLAVVGALLALAQPVLFLYSGALLPDIAATCFLMLALYFLCRWVTAEQAGRMWWGGTVLAGASAAAVGVAFVLKESSIIFSLVPAGLVAALFVRGRFQRAFIAAAAMAVGFFGVIAVELLVFRVVAGQWYSSLLSLLAPHDVAGFVAMQGSTPLARLRTLREVIGSYASLLFVLATLGTLQVLWELVARRRSVRELVPWMMVIAFWAWPAFYFTFGSASLSEYVFPVMQQRYYAPCIVPAVMVTLRLLVSFAGWFPRVVRPVGAVVAGVVVVALLLAPYTERKSRGLIYGAPAKEAFILAVRDVQQRYPGLEIVDTHTGWTTDLNRCRMLLLSEITGEREPLQEVLRSGRDRSGDFQYDYPEDRPFLAIGHQLDLAADSASSSAAPLKRVIAEQQRSVTEVGAYVPLSYRDLGGRWWLPRQQAVLAYVETEGLEAAGFPRRGEDATGFDARTQHSMVNVYLVDTADATP